jgi:ACR3 family arsenite efflux pump ArsB
MNPIVKKILIVVLPIIAAALVRALIRKWESSEEPQPAPSVTA